MEDIIRVLRVIEYVGPRSLVERQLERSLHGMKDHGNGVRISAATIGLYPEILEAEAAPLVKGVYTPINGTPKG